MKNIFKHLISFLPWALPLYLVRFRIGPMPTTLLEVILVVLFVSFTVAHGWKGWHEGWKNLGAWQWPVVAWLVTTFAAIWWAADPIAGLGLWRAYILEPLFVFTILATVKDVAIIKRLQTNLCLVVMFLAGWAVVQFVTGWGIPHPWNVAIGEGRRATGPFPYPNALALFVVPIAAWALSRVSPPYEGGVRGGARVWLLPVLTWCSALVATLLAKSDGGLIALLAAAWFVLVLTKRTRIVTLIATVCLALFVVAVPAIRTSIVKQVTFQEWSGQVRLFIWRETWAMLKTRPILGAGFGGYQEAFKPFHKATAIEIFQYPHQIVFNLWSEAGLLGLFAFGWIVGLWIWKGRKDARMLAPLLAILIHGLVDVPYFKNDLVIVFWMLVWMTTVYEAKG
jgi:O-antigen ligase